MNKHFGGFKQLLNCILMSCDSREAALLKHGRHPGLEKLIFQMVLCFFSPSCTEFLEFQQLSRDPGLPLFERDGPKVLEKTLHVLTAFWAVLLY